MENNWEEMLIPEYKQKWQSIQFNKKIERDN